MVSPPSSGRLVPALVACAALGVALLKLPCGMFWPDEGFYLSSSHRLLLGDRPFVDEVSYATSWFFVVLTPLLAVLPDGGTVVQARLAGLALRLFSAGALLLAFRRGLTRGQMAAALSLTLLASYPGLLVPSYNSLPFDFGFLSLACWCHAARRDGRRAIAWGIAAGVLLAASIVCYLPRVALAAVPAVVTVWAVRARDRTLAWSSGALLAASLAALGGSVAWVHAAGLLGPLVDSIRFQAGSPALSTPLGPRLLDLLRTEWARALPSALVHLAFLSAALAAARSSRAPRALAALAAGASAALLVALYAASGDKTVPAYALVYTGLCALPLLAYPALRARVRAAHPELAVPADLLFLFAGAQQAIVAVTSTQRAAAGIPGLCASLVLLFLLWNALPERAEVRRTADGAVLAFCAALAVTGAAYHFYPEQNPLRSATRTFDSGRLRGIRTGERFVQAWSAIVDGLGPRLQRGEMLLAYEDIPLVYYVTGARPALAATYVSRFVYAPHQQQALLDGMIRQGRIPRYAVRLMPGRADEYVSPSYSRRPEEDPINAFVLEHYALEARYPPFEVYRHRGLR